VFKLHFLLVRILDNTKRRAVLPNEKHEFSAGWQAAQKGGPAGCTTGQASGLHIKLAYRKGQARGLPFSAVRPALFCNPPDHLIMQPISLSKVRIFHLETQPSSRVGPTIRVIPFVHTIFLNDCIIANFAKGFS